MNWFFNKTLLVTRFYSFHLLYLKYLEVLLGKLDREYFLTTQGMWLQDQVKLLLSVRASSRWQKNASWTQKAAGISIRQLYLACLPWLCRLPCRVTFSTLPPALLQTSAFH